MAKKKNDSPPTILAMLASMGFEVTVVSAPQYLVVERAHLVSLLMATMEVSASGAPPNLRKCAEMLVDRYRADEILLDVEVERARTPLENRN